MGAWGHEPWDNDSAADWYSELFDKSSLAKHVATGLDESVEGKPEVVRAAAHVLLSLGHVYIWPVEELKDHLKMAVDKLQALLKADTHVTEDGDAKKAIKRELRQLLQRLKAMDPPEVEQKKVQESPQLDYSKLPGKLVPLWESDIAMRSEAKCEDDPLHTPSTVILLEPLEGDRILVGSHHHLRLLSVTSGESLLDFTQPRGSGGTRGVGMISAAYAVGGLLLYTDDKKIVAYSMVDGRELWKIPAKECVVRASERAMRAAALCEDGLLLIDLKAGKVVHKLEHERPAKSEGASVRISPDGKYVVTSRSGSLRFWNAETGELIKQHRNKYCGIKMTPDGRFIVSVTGTGSVLWDVVNAKKVRKIEGKTIQSYISRIFVTPDDERIVTFGELRASERAGEIISVADRKEEDEPFTAGVESAALDWMNHAQLVTWRDVEGEKGEGFGSEIRVWNVNPLCLSAAAYIERPKIERSEVLGSIPAKKGEVYRIAASPNGKTVFAGDGDGYVYAFKYEE